MSPFGGLTTLDDQPITWSALNSTPSGRAKHRWSAAWPGVNTASMPASTVSPSMDRPMSGVNARVGAARASHARRGPGLPPSAPPSRPGGRACVWLSRMRVILPRRQPHDVGHVLRPVGTRGPAPSPRLHPPAGRCWCRDRSYGPGCRPRCARCRAPMGSSDAALAAPSRSGKPNSFPRFNRILGGRLVRRLGGRHDRLLGGHADGTAGVAGAQPQPVRRPPRLDPQGGCRRRPGGGRGS